jgi:hypothetical protein
MLGIHVHGITAGGPRITPVTVEAMVFSESIALAVVRGTSSYPNRIKTPTNYPRYLRHIEVSAQKILKNKTLGSRMLFRWHMARALGE